MVVIVRRPLEKSKLADVVSEWRRASSTLAKRAADAQSEQRTRLERARHVERDA